MKTIIAAIIVLLVVTAAFAADTNVNFTSPILVNGQKIAAGEYTVRYEIKGNSADVKILQAQKTVATTTATVIENKVKSQYNGVVRQANSDGTSSLKEIQIANEKRVIRFEDAPAVGK